MYSTQRSVRFSRFFIYFSDCLLVIVHGSGIAVSFSVHPCFPNSNQTVGVNNHRQFIIFVSSLVISIMLFDYLVYACKSGNVNSGFPRYLFVVQISHRYLSLRIHHNYRHHVHYPPICALSQPGIRS